MRDTRILSLPAGVLRAPAAEAVLEQLHESGQDERDRREHDEAGKHDVDLIAGGGLHHHDAEAVLGAEEFRHDDAEHGAADREPQAGDDVRQRIRHHHQPRDVPFLGAERAHDVDQDLVGVAHALVGVDQDREQRADEHDHHRGPEPQSEPQHDQRQEHEARRRIEGGDERVEHGGEQARAAEHHAERQSDNDRKAEAEREAGRADRERRQIVPVANMVQSVPTTWLGGAKNNLVPADSVKMRGTSSHATRSATTPAMPRRVGSQRCHRLFAGAARSSAGAGAAMVVPMVVLVSFIAIAPRATGTPRAPPSGCLR